MTSCTCYLSLTYTLGILLCGLVYILLTCEPLASCTLFCNREYLYSVCMSCHVKGRVLPCIEVLQNRHVVSNGLSYVDVLHNYSSCYVVSNALSCADVLQNHSCQNHSCHAMSNALSCADVLQNYSCHAMSRHVTWCHVTCVVMCRNAAEPRT